MKTATRVVHANLFTDFFIWSRGHMMG